MSPFVTNSISFYTSAALVLEHFRTHPTDTIREAAITTKLTERTVLKLIRDLEDAGYLTRSRDGRQNLYACKPMPKIWKEPKPWDKWSTCIPGVWRSSRTLYNSSRLPDKS